MSFTVESDGRVRIAEHCLQGVKWVHLFSCLDVEEEAGGLGAIQTGITGLTEWVSDGDGPAASIGFDFVMSESGRLERAGPPRHNIMIVADGKDAGDGATSAKLACYVDTVIPWRETVLAAISGAG